MAFRIINYIRLPFGHFSGSYFQINFGAMALKIINYNLIVLKIENNFSSENTSCHYISLCANKSI